MIRKLKLQRFEKKVIFIMLIGVFIILNFVMSPVSIRYDASTGQAYTLSSSTKRILSNLNKDVSISFFVSSDLPTRLLPLKSEVLDLLYEYGRSSKKVRLQIVDPKKDEKIRAQAQEFGIPELQFSQLEQNKYAISTAYFGIRLTYQDKQEVIPQVTDISGLEYNITSAIYKMGRKEAVKVGVVEKFSPTSQGDPISIVRQVLSSQYEIGSVSLTEAKPIDPKYKTLLVLDNRSENYATEEANAIRAYLEKRGTAIFFVDGVWVEESLLAMPANHNLSKLLKEYGITLEKNLILSEKAELVNFGNESMAVIVPYNFWVKADHFNSKSSLTTNIIQLTYPWVSSIKINKQSGYDVEELVYTSNRSWSQIANFTLNPELIVRPKERDLKVFTVSAMSSKKDKGKILVVAASRFPEDRFQARGSQNIEFILNAVNDFASAGALSGIRVRSVNLYPIPDLPDNQKDIFKYANILLFPLLFGIFGGWRLFQRR